MTTSTDLISTLTREQLAAVIAEDEWIHVSAGPGSGKSRTIAARVCHLIERGVDPRDICVLTFTLASCSELLARIHGQVGPVASGVRISTFHARALEDGPPLGSLEVATDAHVDAAIESLYTGPRRRPKRDLPGKWALRRAIMRWESECAADNVETLGPVEERAVRTVLSRLQSVDLLPVWELIPRLLRHLEATMDGLYRHVLG